MGWWHAALFGGAGGALAETLSLFRDVSLWAASRRTSTGRLRKNRPEQSDFVDVPAHAWMLLLRAILGAATAAVFAGEITGVYVAVALGLAGPTVLTRLGDVPQIEAWVNAAPRQPGGAPARTHGGDPEELAPPSSGAAGGQA